MIARAPQYGFSLVELSIVLVILGLLTGGILAGQSLIRAAELRGISTEYSRWMTAANTFRDKYFALPGDITNATRLWGAQSGTTKCTNNAGTAAVSTGVCDGNGNGFITNAGSLPYATTDAAEMFQFWRQLAFAGLVEGTFTGLNGSANIQGTVLGSNVPRSRLANAGWAVVDAAPDSASAYTLPDGYGNYFIMGAQLGAGTNLPITAVLKPEEAWNLDTKLDDGKPAAGKIIARYYNNACAAADDGNHLTTNLAASYKLNETTIQCTIYFRHIF